MCGTAKSVKGGITTIVNNYLKEFDYNKFSIRYIPTYITASKPIQILYFLFRYIQIITLLLSRKYGIIHIHMSHKGSTLRKGIIAFAAYLLRIKYIIHLHIEYRPFYESLPHLCKKLVTKIFAHSSCNIVLSDEMALCVQDIAPYSNIKIIPNGVSVPKNNKYNANARNILFLGMLIQRKGIYDFLKCIKLLDSRLSQDTKFYLCGDGNLKSIKQSISDLNINHRISHLGWMNDNQREEIFKNSALSVLPSYNEGLPMSILETMAFGIPNISTNISGISSIIHDGENGVLIEPGDISSLSKSIASLLSDNDKRLNFSNASHVMIKKNFSIDKMIYETFRVYESLV